MHSPRPRPRCGSWLLMDPAPRAAALRRSFVLNSVSGRSTLLRPPTPHGLTVPQPNPSPKRGPNLRASLFGEVGARPHPSEAPTPPGARHEHRTDRHPIHRPPTRRTRRRRHRPPLPGPLVAPNPSRASSRQLPVYVGGLLILLQSAVRPRLVRACGPLSCCR